MLTLPHNSIHQLHSSPKKSSNLLHSSNHLGWFLNHPTPRSFAQKRDNGEVMFIEIIRKNDDSCEYGPEEEGSRTTEGVGVEYFDMFPTMRNFTYIVDFMIVEDISSIINPRLSQVVLGKPFVEISNMTHDSPKGVVRFTNRAEEVAYKLPHMIEQYNSLSDLEKEHTKSVYLRNEVDKRRGVKYVMNKILGFYEECLELGPEFVTGMEDEGEVT
ncbi:hypothetical protein Tco_0363210 [Tanacetum coccineum]